LPSVIALSTTVCSASSVNAGSSAAAASAVPAAPSATLTAMLREAAAAGDSASKSVTGTALVLAVWRAVSSGTEPSTGAESGDASSGVSPGVTRVSTTPATSAPSFSASVRVFSVSFSEPRSAVETRTTSSARPTGSAVSCERPAPVSTKTKSWTANDPTTRPRRVTSASLNASTSVPPGTTVIPCGPS
jgi:hypothetical protein